MQRRDFMRVGLATVASVGLRGIARPEDRVVVRLASPQDLETPLAYFDRLITPTDVFFVRSHFGPPALDRARMVHVQGTSRVDLSTSELRTFPETTVTAVLQCAGNGRSFQQPRLPGVQWGHGAMGQATWTGVRLHHVLERAGIPPDAKYVHLEGWDEPPMPTVPRYLRSIPLSRALDPATLLAYRMNGEPLTLAHGAPMRVVVPSWAGDHWVKWLKTIRLAPDEAPGFYMQTAYRLPVEPVTPGTAVPASRTRSLTAFPVKSVIARPADGSQLARGTAEVVGVAFSGVAPLARVEVSVDGGGRWSDAAREGEQAPGRWQVFRYRFQATPGTLRIVARATDGVGNMQPHQPSWNPSGYFSNGWHSVEVTVR